MTQLLSGVKYLLSPPCDGNTVWCHWHLLKPVHWMRLSREGWSQRDGHKKATSTLNDESSSQRVVALNTQSQLPVEKKNRQMQAHVFSTSSLFLISSSTHTQTNTPRYTPTYLLIYHLHAHVDILSRLPAGVLIAARLFCIHMRKSELSLVLSLFLSHFSHMNTK